MGVDRPAVAAARVPPAVAVPLAVGGAVATNMVIERVRSYGRHGDRDYSYLQRVNLQLSSL